MTRTIFIPRCKPRGVIKHKLRGIKDGPNDVKAIPFGSGGERLDGIITEYREQHGEGWPKDLDEWPGYAVLGEKAGYAPSRSHMGIRPHSGGALYWIKRYHPDIYARVQTFRTVNGKPRGSQGHDNAAKHQQAYEPFYQSMLSWMKEHGLVEGVGLEETPGMTPGGKRALCLAFPTQAEIGKRYGVRDGTVSTWLAEDDKFRPLQDICKLRKWAHKETPDGA